MSMRITTNPNQIHVAHPQAQAALREAYGFLDRIAARKTQSNLIEPLAVDVAPVPNDSAEEDWSEAAA